MFATLSNIFLNYFHLHYARQRNGNLATDTTTIMRHTSPHAQCGAATDTATVARLPPGRQPRTAAQDGNGAGRAIGAILDRGQGDNGSATAQAGHGDRGSGRNRPARRPERGSMAHEGRR